MLNVTLLAKGSLVRTQTLLMAGDGLAAFTSIAPLYYLGPWSSRIPLWVFLYLPVVLVLSFLCEIYRPEQLTARKKIIRSVIACSLSFLVLAFFAGTTQGSYGHLAISLLLFFLFQNTWQQMYQKTSDSHFFAENVLVLGTGSNAKKIEKLIQASPGKYILRGYVRTPVDPVTVSESQIVGAINDIVALAKHHNAHVIIIALTERRGNLAIDKLVTCKLMGVRIMDYPSFFEAMTGKIPVEDINPSWLVQSRGFLITPLIRLFKRMIDIVVASAVLLLVLPFFPIIAVIIKLDSPGNIFYLQERVGENQKPFTIYKFRSMRENAEKAGEASWASENDPRITAFGSFMRKARIDELPQLINVLKGDMSFIGPRPERPEFVQQISKVTPYYLERHAVKPGITGWAQVMYPYGSSIGDSVEKLRYDLYYINHLSLFLELIIILETIKVVLFRKGGR